MVKKLKIAASLTFISFSFLSPSYGYMGDCQYHTNQSDCVSATSSTCNDTSSFQCIWNSANNTCNDNIVCPTCRGLPKSQCTDTVYQSDCSYNMGPGQGCAWDADVDSCMAVCGFSSDSILQEKKKNQSKSLIQNQKGATSSLSAPGTNPQKAPLKSLIKKK